MNPLIKELGGLLSRAEDRRYLVGTDDIFALGYLAGKYGVTKFFFNQEELMKACKEYDKTDVLKINDTIGEILIDLDILDNSEKEL